MRRTFFIVLPTLIFLHPQFAAATQVHKCDRVGELIEPLSDAIDRGPSSGHVTLPTFGSANWTPHIGKKVTVEFGHRKVDQVILDSNLAGRDSAKAVRDLLDNTYLWKWARLFRVEVGMWQIVTDKGVHSSEIFTSGDRDNLYLGREGAEPRRKVEESARNETPRELIIYHTHIGTGEPLNWHDTGTLEKQAAAAFAKFPTLQVVRIYAVPVGNQGKLLFRASIFR